MGYQKFIILSHARSGSNLLVHLLHDHPHIQSYGELFHKAFFLGNPGTTFLEHPLVMALYRRLRTRFPVWTVKNLIFRWYSSTIEAVGFKLLYSHARTDKSGNVWEYLRALPDLKIISLHRKNLFHSYVSLQTAYQTNVFITLGTARRSTKKVTLKLKAKDCEEYFQRIDNWQREAAVFFKNTPTLKLSYEELVSKQPSSLRKVQQFLGVPVRELRSSVQKQNTHTMREVVTNYTALKKAFVKTKWRIFFDE